MLLSFCPGGLGCEPSHTLLAKKLLFLPGLPQTLSLLETKRILTNAVLKTHPPLRSDQKPRLTPCRPPATVSSEADSNRNFSVLVSLNRFVNLQICSFLPFFFLLSFPPAELSDFISVPFHRFYLQADPEPTHVSQTTLPPGPSAILS